MKVLLHELRQALRALTKNLGFSALVVAVLAAGLACVIFMLVMINGLVLKPLPYPQPERLLHAGLVASGGDGRLDDMSGKDLLDLRRRLYGKADAVGIGSATVNLSDLDRPERYAGAVVSSGFAHVLGLAPTLGRDFTEADEQPGAPAVVLLSETLWRSRYGGDPAIIGRVVRVNAHPATVVGVLPAFLTYPFGEVVWIPATLRADVPDRDNSYAFAMRLRDGVDAAQVATVVDAWRNDGERDDPARFRGAHAGVEPLAYYSVARTTRAVLGIMLAAVVLVLLVACANAANLLLLRTLRRRQELAVRVALGASRGRIALHLLMQSLLLAAVAAAIAMPLAAIAARWQAQVLRAQSSGTPDWLRFDLDGTVIALALGAALLTALVTGLLPALRAARDTVAGTLRDGTRGNAGGTFARLSRALVVGEVALSCALLIVVGTMVKGIVALDRIDLGFNAAHLLTARIALFDNTYATGADQVRLYEKLTERLRSDAEVVDASVATMLPLNVIGTRDILPDGTPAEGDAALPKVRYGAVDDKFQSTYGLRLLQGRFLDARDDAASERVAVVDSVFAQRNGDDVVGRRFRLDPRDADGEAVTIVGVIAPLRLESPNDAPQPVLLAPLRQDPSRFVNLVVRLHGEPNAFAPRLAALMREVDANTPLYSVRDFRAVIAEATFGEHFIAQFFAAFGIVVLILAGAGLYGITAFSVGQRTREIGVRRALGAPTRGVLRSLFARTGWQIGIGLGVGVALGAPLARTLAGTLPSLGGSSLTTLLLAVAVLIAAAALAVVVPARRALRIDPTEALRHE
jgi:predicted permease